MKMFLFQKCGALVNTRTFAYQNVVPIGDDDSADGKKNNKYKTNVLQTWPIKSEKSFY